MGVTSSVHRAWCNLLPFGACYVHEYSATPVVVGGSGVLKVSIRAAGAGHEGIIRSPTECAEERL